MVVVVLVLVLEEVGGDCYRDAGVPALLFSIALVHGFLVMPPCTGTETGTGPDAGAGMGTAL